MLPFTPEELKLAVDEGRVYARRHPTLPLTIYNYSDEVAFGGWWNAVTLNCRGLILDDNFNVVARPWAKFFNVGQRDNEIAWDAPVEVTDKLDGSLGILYPHRQFEWAISTRGSFESEQALEGTAILHANYRQDFPNFLEDNTYLFEIIYPRNRIVVNYGDTRDLVLLGAVNKRYGYYVGPHEAQSEIQWSGPVAEVFNFDNFTDALANWPERPGKEGVVVRSGNKMVKLKQPDYLELHKLVTNASPLNCWRQLKEGHTTFQIVSRFPDEFQDYIFDMCEPLLEAYSVRFNEILDGFDRVMVGFMSKAEDFNRGGFARYIKNEPDKRYYFLLLDSREIRDVLWQELRPREAVHVHDSSHARETD